MTEETTLTVAVRQAATALLAQQVHNTEGVSALYQGLMAVNEEIKETVILGRELDELTKDLQKISDALEAAEDDGQALKDMCKRLGADVKQVNDKLSGLNEIIPILQGVEKKVEQLADKASEVDGIMGRLRQLEADMQGLSREPKQNASKSRTLERERRRALEAAANRRRRNNERSVCNVVNVTFPEESLSPASPGSDLSTQEDDKIAAMDVAKIPQQ